MPVSVAMSLDRGAAAEHGARGEVLDLALAVDRGVGDHGDRLLEVVGQVLALGRERGQRAVVAQGADRLGAVGGHLLAELHVVALPAEAGEDAVLHLHRLGRAGGRVARDLGALERATGHEGAVPSRRLATGPLGPALGDQPLHVGVLVERGLALLGVDRHQELLAGAQRKRLGDHVVDAHHAGLGGEDVVVGRLDLPERAQAHRVGAEDALVAMAGDQGNGALRERAHRLAQVHVEGVELVRKRADLVDDRRDDHLHRLGQREAVATDQRVDHAV